MNLPGERDFWTDNPEMHRLGPEGRSLAHLAVRLGAWCCALNHCRWLVVRVGHRSGRPPWYRKGRAEPLSLQRTLGSEGRDVLHSTGYSPVTDGAAAPAPSLSPTREATAPVRLVGFGRVTDFATNSTLAASATFVVTSSSLNLFNIHAIGRGRQQPIQPRASGRRSAKDDRGCSLPAG